MFWARKRASHLRAASRRTKRVFSFSQGRRKNIFIGRSRAGRDPSSVPRRLVRTPVAVHLLPLGEGKHSFYAPPRVIGFPSPRGRGWAGEPQRGEITKPRPTAWVNGTPNRYPSPEGAEQSFSIPHVPLVVGDSVRVQQLSEFLLKADRAVVGFLPCAQSCESDCGMGEHVARPFRAAGENWG